MDYRYNLTADGHIDGIGLSFSYEYVFNGTEPFADDYSKAFNYQLIDGQWQLRTWSELQIVSVTYDWQRAVCIVSLSNGDVCEFPCAEEWSTAKVIIEINNLSKYSETIIG